MSEPNSSTDTPAGDKPSPRSATRYPLPRYIYKILPSAPPAPLPVALEISALDRRDGYIHLSAASEVVGTAARFFADAPALWLLKVDSARAAAPRGSTEAEGDAGRDGGGGGGGGCFAWTNGRPGFPHLFSAEPGRDFADLGSGSVVEIREVGRVEGQTWEEALKQVDGWMVDG